MKSSKTALLPDKIKPRDIVMDELNGIVSRVSEDTCTDDDFGKHLVSSLKSLYQDEQLCDFAIHVENKKFKVHRVIMASTSDYFRAMFSHDVLENRQDFVDLKGLTAKGVEPLLKYAYSGNLTLSLENLEDVMNAATFLQVTNAIDLCVLYIKKKLNFENADYLLKIADLFSLSHLRKYNREYILTNFLKFALTEQFLNLDADTLADYLSDDSLNTTSECILLHYVIKWYEHDPKEREKVAFHVFDKIRYVIDGWPTINFALNSEPFKKIPKLAEILKFCDFFMTNPEIRFLCYDHRTRERYPHKTLIQICGATKFWLDEHGFDLLSADEESGWNRCHFYHPQLKKWYKLGPCESLENAVAHASLTEVNDNAIICGGFEYDFQIAGYSNEKTTRTAQIFNPYHLSMWPLEPLQHERARHSSAFLAGYIYVIGGKDNRQPLASVERLDCSKNKWSYVKRLSKPLYSHGAAACEGKVYISGGIEDRAVTNKVWCYDPTLNKWNKKTSLNSARASHCMIQYNNKVYVCGGFSNIVSCLSIVDSVEMYEVSTNQWTYLKSMLLGTCQSSITILDGQIVILGGADDKGEATDIIQQYNPGKNLWTLYGQLPRPLKGAACCAATMKLTPDGKKPTDEIWEKYEKLLDPETDSLDEDMDNLYLSDYSDESY